MSWMNLLLRFQTSQHALFQHEENIHDGNLLCVFYIVWGVVLLRCPLVVYFPTTDASHTRSVSLLNCRGYFNFAPHKNGLSRVVDMSLARLQLNNNNNNSNNTVLWDQSGRKGTGSPQHVLSMWIWGVTIRMEVTDGSQSWCNLHLDSTENKGLVTQLGLGSERLVSWLERNNFHVHFQFSFLSGFSLVVFDFLKVIRSERIVPFVSRVD